MGYGFHIDTKDERLERERRLDLSKKKKTPWQRIKDNWNDPEKNAQATARLKAADADEGRAFNLLYGIKEGAPSLLSRSGIDDGTQPGQAIESSPEMQTRLARRMQDDGTQPGQMIEASPEGRMQGKMDAAIRKAGADQPGYDEQLALGRFRTPSGPVENDARGVLGQNVRMVGNTEKRGRYTGTGWSGGPAVELSDQESAAYEAAKQQLRMQALGLRGAVEMKRGEAEDAREAEKSIGEQIRNLEKRKRQMGKALGEAARSVEGSRGGAGRWGGWIDQQKGKIDTQIAALRREMREGKVRAMTLGEVAKATETDLKGLKLGMDRAALAAVFDLRAAGQQQAQAQQMAVEQENYARAQDQRKWTGEQERARFEQDLDRQGMQSEAQTKRVEALEKAIGLVDTELADEKQSFTKEGKTALTQRRSVLQERLLQALEETGAGASGAAGGDSPEVQEAKAKGFTPEQIQKLLEEKARRTR